MYACMYVCTYVYMCMHACMYVCMYKMNKRPKCLSLGINSKSTYVDVIELKPSNMHKSRPIAIALSLAFSDISYVFSSASAM